VHYDAGRCCGPEGLLSEGSVYTDAAGAYRFEVPFEATDFGMNVSAGGFVSFFDLYRTGDLPSAATIDVALQPVPPPVVNPAETFTGLVYDASVSSSAAIAGADVSYRYYIPSASNVSGTLRTDADGRFQFTYPFGLGGSQAEIEIAAPGYAPVKFYSVVLKEDLFEVGLIPSGGIIDIQPAELSLQCQGEFVVTISNLAPPGETMVITDIFLHHRHSQGWYGTDFTWDTSHIELPAFLDGGEHLSIPVAFEADTSRPLKSALGVSVATGAREGRAGVGYFGHVCVPTPTATPQSPTPTHTPPAYLPCSGDCDGDRIVTISELVRAVAMALGPPVIAIECPSLDGNRDTLISVDELVTAVRNALGGCGS
jgi:hypothetical protein